MPKRFHKRQLKRSKTSKYISFRYTQSVLFVFSVLITILIVSNDTFHEFLLHLGTYEYIGVFFAGFFWVSTLTIAPASALFIILTENLPIWAVALIGGLGAVIGDSMIFNLIRHTSIADEVLDMFKRLGGKKLIHVFRSPHLRWTWPFIGAIIIVSPLPDELGVSLMGVSKLGYPLFALISYLLNTLGILLLLFAFSGVRL